MHLKEMISVLKKELFIHENVSLQHLTFGSAAAGALSAFVGFAAAFAILLQGLISTGASPVQAASGLMAASIAMGGCAVFLSLRCAQPITTAWSTPGAAFLATLMVPEGGFEAAVGAFIVAALLIILAGLWRPLGLAVAKIPASLASAMLAGVLLPLCLAPFQAISAYPVIGLPIVLTWFVIGRWKRLLAVPAAVGVALGLIGIYFGAELKSTDLAWTGLVLVKPTFTFSSITGIAIPLFIITMAAQNVAGIAVLANFNYRPDPGKIFSWTGFFSLLAAPFGSHAVNLSSITAAICAEPACHRDSARRYWASVVGGGVHVVLGVLAGFAVVFISISPPVLIAAVAGLALLGAFAASLKAAVSVPAEIEAAIVTFLVTTSGGVFLGIGGAFWGLLAGGAVYYSNRILKTVQ